MHKPLFPYFGGKRRLAPLVWERFGHVRKYIEPFAGGLAVLLACPKPATVEIINDSCGFVTNAWRALQRDPDGVIHHATQPVHHIDLVAWRRKLLGNTELWDSRLANDTEYFDAEVAGRWMWLQSASINGSAKGTTRPHYGSLQGCISLNWPASALQLSRRISEVRTSCGDWSQLVTSGGMDVPRWTPTGVFLDPPYANAIRATALYLADDGSVTTDVLAWCQEHGTDKRLRIALCGYLEEYDGQLPGWDCVAWRAVKGMRTTADTRDKERVWFSPGCLQDRQGSLFTPKTQTPT